MATNPRFTVKGGRIDRNYQPRQGTRNYSFLLYLRNLNGNITLGQNAPENRIEDAISNAGNWIAEERIRSDVVGVKGNEDARQLLVWLDQQLTNTVNRQGQAQTAQTAQTAQAAQAAQASQKALTDEIEVLRNNVRNLKTLFELAHENDDWFTPMISDHLGDTFGDLCGRNKHTMLDNVAALASSWVRVRLRSLLDGFRNSHGVLLDYGRATAQWETYIACNRAVHQYDVLDDALIARADRFPESNLFTPPAPIAGPKAKVGIIYEHFYGLTVEQGDAFSTSPRALSMGPRVH